MNLSESGRVGVTVVVVFHSSSTKDKLLIALDSVASLERHARFKTQRGVEFLCCCCCAFGFW